MLTVISPAKTLDFDSPSPTPTSSTPDFLDSSTELVALMRKQSAKKLSKLMGISSNLAELNKQRFQDYSPPFTKDNAKQALMAFKGDVYLGIQAETFSQRDFKFAQKNLRILSGLYGLLKPLDLIQAYRLEMGTKITNKRGKDLYEFWGERISQSLADELARHRNKTLINLASKEYFKSVRPDLLPGKVITPIFKDYSNGSYKILGFYAKKARGSMAAYITKNAINQPEKLKAFNEDGYQYNEDYSSDYDWVFTRKAG